MLILVSAMIADIVMVVNGNSTWIRRIDMIWYYIAGFISGVIGTLMFGRYLSKKMEERDREV